MIQFFTEDQNCHGIFVDTMRPVNQFKLCILVLVLKSKEMTFKKTRNQC